MLVSTESSHVARTTRVLVGIGTVEVRDDLLVLIAEQRGLRRKEHPVDAPERVDGLAFVVLKTGGVTEQERLVWCVHLETRGHNRRCDGLGLCGLRQRA
jgi:hypothetical protein